MNSHEATDTHPELTILHATTAHVEQIARLFDEYRVWCGKRSDIAAARNFLTHRFNNHESVIFLAHVGQFPAAFAQLYPLFSSVEMAPVWILNDLFVSLPYRHQGIGTQLLKAAADFGEQVGALRLELEVDFGNSAARTVYEADGWEELKSTARYYLNLEQNSHGSRSSSVIDS